MLGPAKASPGGQVLVSKAGFCHGLVYLSKKYVFLASPRKTMQNHSEIL